MESCVFCQIVNGVLPGYIVLEDEVSMAFLDKRPLFHGHVLLVPREHYETLADLPPELVEPLFANAQILSRAMQTVLGSQGSFVAMNNIVSQSVPHLHIHVVPRTKMDGLRGFFWPRTTYTDEEIVAVAERLRTGIDEMRANAP